MLPSMQAVLCTASARGLDSLVSWIGKASVELCSNWCEAASDLSALPGRDRNQARRPVARLQLGGLPEGWDGVWQVGASEVWDMAVYAWHLPLGYLLISPGSGPKIRLKRRRFWMRQQQRFCRSGSHQICERLVDLFGSVVHRLEWVLADLVKFHRTENGHRLLIVHERPERLYACPSRNPDLILEGVH